MAEALELRVCFFVGKGCDEAVREIGGAGTTGRFRLTTIFDSEYKGNGRLGIAREPTPYLDLFTHASQ